MKLFEGLHNFTSRTINICLWMCIPLRTINQLHKISAIRVKNEMKASQMISRNYMEWISALETSLCFHIWDLCNEWCKCFLYRYTKFLLDPMFMSMSRLTRGANGWSKVFNHHTWDMVNLVPGCWLFLLHQSMWVTGHLFGLPLSESCVFLL